MGVRLSSGRVSGTILVRSKLAVPPEPPYLDPDWDKVVLRMTFDGTDGDTTIKDLKNPDRVFSRIGTEAHLSSTQAKFGTTSLRATPNSFFTMLGDHPDFDFGLDDFTIEFWLWRFDATTGGQGVVVKYANEIGTNSFMIEAEPTNVIFLSPPLGTATGTSSPTSQVWDHYAFMRHGTDVLCCRNGVREGLRPTFTLPIPHTTTPLTIGGWLASGYRQGLDGYLDDLRITRGLARYPNPTYTVPTKALPVAG